jgi:hypothetical protein
LWPPGSRLLLSRAITITVNGLDYSFDLAAAQSTEHDTEDA